MGERTTATSQTVEYETGTCIHCGDEVFIDDDMENVDGLPEAVHVLIGGGKHLSTEETPMTARNKNYRVPKVVLKWFGGDSQGEMVRTQHMCLSCAKTVYGFEPDN